jgi:tetratricopeptide (TPR) repeat protein
MRISTLVKSSAIAPRGYIVWFFLLLFSAASAQDLLDYEELLQKANVAVKERKPVEAERIIATIINTSNRRKNLAIKGEAHRLMASICASHSRKAEEIEHLFESYWFFTEAKENLEEAEAQRLIGQYYLHMKLPDEADRYLKNAFQISIGLNDTIAQIKVMSNQAQLASSRNRVDQSLKLYEQAILLSQKMKWRQGLLENWNRMAYAYWKKGDPRKMLACMKEALPNTTPNTDTLGIIYGDLGLAFMENEVLDSADRYLQKGLEYIKKGENTQQEMLLYKQLYRLKVMKRKRLSF